MLLVNPNYFLFEVLMYKVLHNDFMRRWRGRDERERVGGKENEGRGMRDGGWGRDGREAT